MVGRLAGWRGWQGKQDLFRHGASRPSDGQECNADGHGLYLRVADGGSKGWIFRYQLAGRRREMGLGSAATFSLVEARDRARQARQCVAENIDPVDDRRSKISAAALDRVSAMTFRQCAERYMRAHGAGWGVKHAGQFRGSIEAYVYPVLGDLSVQAIDVGLVMRIIEPIWTAKPETASRIRGRIESVLDWATARGYRAGENPARWRGHVENLLPNKTKVRAVEHHAALAYNEIAGFMSELHQLESGPTVYVAARALEFAILTAARTGEVLGAKWSEISATERLWTIPAARMKARKEHRVPLSDAAFAIVTAMAAIRVDDWVFPSVRKGHPLSGMAFLRVLQEMGYAGRVTAHGFRSTFRDWAAELTSFPAEVAEMALAHAVGDKVEAAYRRGDLFQKRRQLAEAWAKFCATEPPPTGEIIPINAKAAQL
jgi:integrase